MLDKTFLLEWRNNARNFRWSEISKKDQNDGQWCARICLTQSWVPNQFTCAEPFACLFCLTPSPTSPHFLFFMGQSIFFWEKRHVFLFLALLWVVMTIDLSWLLQACQLPWPMWVLNLDIVLVHRFYFCFWCERELCIVLYRALTYTHHVIFFRHV